MSISDKVIPPAGPRSAGAVVDVQQFIDHRPFGRFQWLIVAFCFLVVALDGFDTAIMGFIAPALVDDWGIPRAALSPVLSAALFGLAIGALTAGPLADRYGRRLVLNCSVLFFGLWTLAAAFSEGVTSLVILRFLTGLGLGAAMPNAITLTSEYSPARKRALMTMVMFAGFTLGSAAGGLIAAHMIDAFGWRSILLLGGVMPIVLFAFMLWKLPESPRYLVVRHGGDDRIRALLSRMAPGALRGQETFSIPEKPDVQNRRPLGVIFVDRLAFGTGMLWFTYFMGLLIIYLLGSWLPTLIRDAGFTLDKAAVVTALFQIGGTFGAILVGYLMDRMSPQRIIAISYAVGSLFIFSVGHASTDLMWLSLAVLGAGFCMSGSQSAMTALAATFYPTRGRATGVSWMLGIGRFGAIAGAVIGGEMLRLNWSFPTIFSLLAIPALLAATALTLMERYYTRLSKLPEAVTV
jgi:AAHS family 4-hydroxybenzoate transporter-like MFS transporter